VLTRGGEDIRLFSSDIADWKITFVDTGLHSNFGPRLLRVQHHFDGEPMFLANYSDGLSDLTLPAYLEQVARQDKVASFMRSSRSNPDSPSTLNFQGVTVSRILAGRAKRTSLPSLMR
jgi:NDP-sugar pyrophosphorylase family protein